VKCISLFFFVLLAALASLIHLPVYAAEEDKPNILIIWGDDIGMWNVSAYHRGMMGGSTPNIDSIASEGMIFMDHYAHASCTAGRAAFMKTLRENIFMKCSIDLTSLRFMTHMHKFGLFLKRNGAKSST